ncbi:hypothetical protein Tco_0227239 [Tanacetum coccineum]
MSLKPKGFEDPYFPSMYTEWLKLCDGLHQAPGDWFYVDDIIFGSTNKVWCDVNLRIDEKSEFEMSAMGRDDFLLRSYSACSLTLSCGPQRFPFQLEAYSDSDMPGSHGIGKSTTGILFSCGCRLYLIPAGSYSSCWTNGYCLVGSMVLLVVILPADEWFLLLVYVVLLVVIFPAARLDSAGCTMALLEVIVPAGFFVPAGSYGLCCCHLVSADSIQSCWWNNVSAA